MTPFWIPESAFLKSGIKCKYCGSERVALSGPNYECKEKGCGRRFRKNPRQRKIPAEERPPCPDCGAENPYSMGFAKGKKAWLCRTCGRNYIGESGKTKQVEVDVNLEVQVE